MWLDSVLVGGGGTSVNTYKITAVNLQKAGTTTAKGPQNSEPRRAESGERPAARFAGPQLPGQPQTTQQHRLLALPLLCFLCVLFSPHRALTGEVEHLLEGHDVEDGQEQRGRCQSHAHQEANQAPRGAAGETGRSRFDRRGRNRNQQHACRGGLDMCFVRYAETRGEA